MGLAIRLGIGRALLLSTSALAVATTSASVVRAQAPARLVADIDPRIQTMSSEPEGFTACPGTGLVFFSAERIDTGRELWASDGTVEGTGLVLDLEPGVAGAGPRDFLCAGSALYFTAEVDGAGRRLWRSDGTAEGTAPVTDPNLALSSTAAPEELVLRDDTLFFVADDGVHGRELWRTTGTASSTEMVADVFPGPEGSKPAGLALVGTELFFRAGDDVHGWELWKSDGTAAGTSLVRDIVPGPTSPIWKGDEAAAGGLYFFVIDDRVNFTRLWRSDGTAEGTFMVADPSVAPYTPRYVTAMGDRVYFSGETTARGRELWASDGSPGGTVLVANIAPGGFHADPYDLTAVGGLLFFSAEDLVHGRELWKTDGTTAGTSLVVDLTPGDSRSDTSISCLQDIGGLVTFFAYTPELGRRYWLSDGTLEGTAQLIDPIGGTTHGLAPVGCGAFLGDQFFAQTSATGFGDPAILGREVGVTDGTAAGTFVLNLAPDDGTRGSNPGMFAEADGRLFFVAYHPEAGSEVSLYDPATGTVELVKDVDPTETASSAASGNLYFSEFAGFDLPEERFFRVGDAMLFRGRDDGANDWEPWRTDGTEAGTYRVRDIVPGPGASLRPYFIVFPRPVPYPLPWWAGVVGDELFFEAYTAATGDELWKSDGTSEGTVPVADIYPGPSSSSIAEIVDIDGTAYFSAYEPTHQRQLWKSDGTPEGTVRVSEIEAGSAGSTVSNLVVMDGQVYFTASTAEEGVELWTSDGTTAGTRIVRDIVPGPESSSPRAPFVWRGALYFSADDGVHGRELWRSEGTPDSTALLLDALEGAGGADPEELAATDELLFFATSQIGKNDTLWSSDGTAAGTHALATLGDPEVSNVYVRGIEGVTAIDGVVLFQGLRPDTGRELWVSDGTRANTRLFVDLEPGEFGSSPSLFTRVADVVVFQATTHATGSELWEIPLSALDELRADADHDGVWDVSENDLGLDPCDPDTDDDGLSDGDELNLHGSDPLDRDSDGDGYCDGRQYGPFSSWAPRGRFPRWCPSLRLNQLRACWLGGDCEPLDGRGGSGRGAFWWRSHDACTSPPACGRGVPARWWDRSCREHRDRSPARKVWRR